MHGHFWHHIPSLACMFAPEHYRLADTVSRFRSSLRDAYCSRDATPASQSILTLCAGHSYSKRSECNIYDDGQEALGDVSDPVSQVHVAVGQVTLESG